ncbi:MAG: pyridoxal phosphate-dependent aminotransferase [Candidatus Riflebacteria bacterium]|nr:pyridoxal phosphate-dependent aminotransferase [Candidatus Riflebacteria bacterium]
MAKINPIAKEIPFYLTKQISEGAAAEPGAVNLSRGQAGFLPCQKIYDEAKRIISREDKTIFRYEKSAGAKDLRKSIASWYGRMFDLEVNPASIAVTVGGTGAISLTLQTFTKFGDQIVIPDPSYPFYTLSAAHSLDGRDITRLPLGFNKVSANNLRPLIKNNMQMLILTSPHNPTGFIYDKETLTGLVDLAEEKDFFIMYDENHFPEIYDKKKHLPVHLFDRKRKFSIMLGSLARLGLQGERIGWAVLPESPDITSTFIAQSPFTCTRAQRLARFVLDNYENLEFGREFQIYEEKRNWLIPRLNELEGFTCPMPEGTSYAFPNIRRFVEAHKKKLMEKVRLESKKRNISEEEIELSMRYNSILVYKYMLYHAGVGCVPGIAYGPNSDDYIRLTFSADKQELEEGFSRLKERLFAL